MEQKSAQSWTDWGGARWEMAPDEDLGTSFKR
jgi:hypothetical protein